MAIFQMKSLREQIVAGRPRLWLLGLALIVASSLMVVAVLVNMVGAAAHHEEAQRRHSETLDRLLAAKELEAAFAGAARAEQGFLLTRDSALEQPLLDAGRRARPLVARLRSLSGTDPDRQRMVTVIGAQAANLFETLTMNLALERAGNWPPHLRELRIDTSKDQMDAFLVTMRMFEMEEKRLLAPQRQAAAEAAAGLELQRMLLAGSSILLLLVCVTSIPAALRFFGKSVTAVAELRRISVTDELTGLRNRRAFSAAVEAEVARTRDTGEAMSLILFRVEGLRAVNDEHGHGAGDEILRAVSRILRSSAPSGGALGRIGGDEFALLVPGADRRKAQRLGDRIVEAALRTHVSLPTGRRARVSIRAGAVSALQWDSTGSLLQRADDALSDIVPDFRPVRLAA